MPTWLSIAVAAATPLLAFLGAMLGHLFSRKAARELDVWRRREETLRMLRWGAERAVDERGRVGEVGIAALHALSASELLQPEDRDFIDRVTQAVIEGTLAEVDASGADVLVVEE